MRRFSWAVILIAALVSAILAPSAMAAPAQATDGPSMLLLAQDWLHSLWELVYGLLPGGETHHIIAASKNNSDRGPELDPNGILQTERGPELDPNGGLQSGEIDSNSP